MTLSQYLSLPGVTASGLARAMGVSHTTILRWADGTISPDVERLRKLHEVTDQQVSPNDWLAPRPPARRTEAAGLAA